MKILTGIDVGLAHIHTHLNVLLDIVLICDRLICDLKVDVFTTFLH